MNANQIPFESLTSYQRWCIEKSVPDFTSEKYLQWLEVKAWAYGDVKELESGLYNMFFPIFCDEVVAATEKLLSTLIESGAVKKDKYD